MTDYRDRLAAARAEAKLSKRELSRRMRYSVSGITETEQHLRHLLAPQLIAWAVACGKSLDWIAGDPIIVATFPDDAIEVELELGVLP